MEHALGIVGFRSFALERLSERVGGQDETPEAAPAQQAILVKNNLKQSRRFGRNIDQNRLKLSSSANLPVQRRLSIAATPECWTVTDQIEWFKDASISLSGIFESPPEFGRPCGRIGPAILSRQGTRSKETGDEGRRHRLGRGGTDARRRIPQARP
jgi:hypothetical protein